MTTADEALIVWSNAPDAATAEKLAETLVQEGLAACVHVLAEGRSFYVWEGKLEKDTEWTLMIKTRRGRYEKLAARLTELHPYDVPEILATPIENGHPAYLEWLHRSTG
ncbi:MAG: divalent-cation tolerance protein CutA [Magnetococcales bacterium]|nr:divalent-cation tolerance protein CutA [Magnetococcales bacterium]